MSVNENVNKSTKKREIESRNEFFKHLNSNCQLTTEEDQIIIEMNQFIMGGITQPTADNKQTYEEINSNSELVNKFTTTLKHIYSTRLLLNKVKTEIDDTFEKLNLILDSRNILSNILKEFNNSTLSIMNEKEKNLKLKMSIEKIYKMYEETHSIEAFFESTKDDCVEKIRFTSDYEAIENGINFFTLNHCYIEANNYLNTYNMLKRIAITRYYNYMSNSLQSFFNLFDGVTIEDEFLLLFYAKNMDRKFYNFPKNFEKMRSIQNFFEGKSSYDHEVKKVIEGIKQKFIDQRLILIKPFYGETFTELNLAFCEESVGDLNRKVHSTISDIFKMTIIEIIFFTKIFQTKASENTFILQKLISDVYDNLYDNLRPVIINSQNLDELFVLFEGLSDNFGIFFVNASEENREEVVAKILLFFSNMNTSINQVKLNVIIKDNIDKLVAILQVSKILIRPKILKLIQDIQEKIVFKINLHIKNSLLELESDFPNLSVHEERISQNYDNFSLFHFFLRRLAIVFELLKNKLDKQIINKLTVFAIEKFLNLLNEEILNNKILTFEFEIYVIQQIILGIKILEEFDVEAIQTRVDIDFFSITDGIKNNLQSLFTNLNIKDIIINSAPKLCDSTKDFKKLLFYKLVKSYKIFINLVNDFIFGRDVMDVVYKIRNKENIGEELLNLRLKDKKQVFMDILKRYANIMEELKNQIRVIDISISDKLVGNIIENISNILCLLKDEMSKYKDFEDILCIMDKELLDKSMNDIRINLFT